MNESGAQAVRQVKKLTKDLSDQVETADYRQLLKAFHRYFEQA